MIAAARRRLIFWLPVALLLAMALFWLFRPRPLLVDLAAIERGPLQVAVSDEGETRVMDIFVVSAPVTGRMRRIELEPGDEVIAHKTIIARIEPAELDVRSEAEARAAMHAAQAAHAFALASVERATAEREFAQSELNRLGALAKERVISQNDLEAAQRRARTAAAGEAEAQALVRVRDFELQNARARLLGYGATGKDKSSRTHISVYSPVSGQVLRVVTESEGVVTPGMPLVEVGDPSRLEVVVDLLSTDAVHVRPGQRVLIEAWGGAKPLDGVVRRVEPAGFNKISALGVEEQRVNVIIDFAGPAGEWRSLGHGFRVEPSIVLWESPDAVKAPLSALFRDGERWAVFVESKGRAELRYVELGRRNGSEAQVLSGLQVGERVILHPADRVSAGIRLKVR